MRSKLPALLLPALLLLGAADADPVVAQRGADQITLSQARIMVQSLDAASQQKLKDPSAMLAFFRNLLLQRAILAQANSENWGQRPDVADALRRAREQILVQTYLSAHAQPAADYPPEANIKAAYEQNKTRFMQTRAYHVAQIFAPQEKTKSPAQGRSLLMFLRRDILRTKISMQSAAKKFEGFQYSDMGWIEDQQLLPAIKTSIAGLPEGTLSDPVCIENGCHLLQLIATRPAGPAPLEQVRATLVQALRQQKQQAQEAAYASDLLARQAVVINRDRLNDVLR